MLVMCRLVAAFRLVLALKYERDRFASTLPATRILTINVVALGMPKSFRRRVRSRLEMQVLRVARRYRW